MVALGGFVVFLLTFSKSGNANSDVISIVGVLITAVIPLLVSILHLLLVKLIFKSTDFPYSEVIYSNITEDSDKLNKKNEEFLKILYSSSDSIDCDMIKNDIIDSQKCLEYYNMNDKTKNTRRRVIVRMVVFSILQQLTMINMFMISFTQIKSEPLKEIIFDNEGLILIANVVGTIIAMLFIEKHGRMFIIKTGNASILLIFFSAWLVSLIFQGETPKYYGMFAFLLFILYFGFSYGPIYWVMSAELLFPHELPIPSIANYILSYAVALTGSLIGEFTIKSLHWIMLVVIAAMAFGHYFLRFMKETTQLHLNDLFSLYLTPQDPPPLV